MFLLYKQNKYNTKDFKKRYLSAQQELQLKFLRYLIFNQKLDLSLQALRLKAFILYVELGRKKSFTQLNNRCRVSGRSKSVYKKYGVSRLFLKKYIHQGLVAGIIKAAW